ncbi:MAG: T9SS type A sorting domain-containing protein, partial [Ginsengibacter sp.]
FKGTNYYRLSMVDLDGKMSYSKTVAVNVKVTHSFTTGYARLSSETKKINFTLNSDREQSVRAAITDVTGRIYFTESLQLQAGTNSFNKNIPAFSKGIYYLKFSTDEELITKTLLAE